MHSDYFQSNMEHDNDEILKSVLAITYKFQKFQTQRLRKIE